MPNNRQWSAVVLCCCSGVVVLCGLVGFCHLLYVLGGVVVYLASSTKVVLCQTIVDGDCRYVV